MSGSISQQRQRRTGRWQFLAHKADVAQLYESGMTVIMIWEKLRDENRLSLSYPQFARYVRDHFKDAGPSKDQSPKNEPTDNGSRSSPKEPKGFSFTPYAPLPGAEDDNLI